MDHLRITAWLAAAALGLLLTAGCGRAAEGSKARDVIGYFWVPDGDTSPYWTLADHRAGISVLAPTWLSYDASGTFRNISDARLLRWAKRHGIKVTPLVANHPFKPETARPVFETDEAIARNVALLLKTVQDMGADGLNVDIEGVAPADRGRYNAFIEALCKAFHEKDLIVTAAVPAKTSDAPTGAWAGFADYEFLGKHLDQVQLMCYDEHWSGGSPGPIASIPWVDKVLAYATTVIPREKVVMGLPFYGYDWPAEGSASEMTATRAGELIKAHRLSPKWDETARTWHFTYDDAKGEPRTVYYEDARTLAERLDLARKHRVAGVAIWRLGDETADFWPLLTRYRSGE